MIDRFQDDVPDEVKRRRNNDLLAVQQDVGEQPICFDGDPSLKGRILDVRVTAASQMTLFGEMP